MAWITISEDAIRSKLAAVELQALRTAALADGQADPLPEIVARTVDEVRGYIGACERNRLGPAGTIPAQLESAALAIVRYRLATRLPVRTLLTEERKEEQRDALTLLRDVAACRYAVEQPDEAGPERLAIGGTPKIIPRPATAGMLP
jgi:phage gp36-like protein